MDDAIPVPFDIWCKRCFYNLRGLTSRRCPECALEFDPDIPASFSRRPSPEPLVEKLASIFTPPPSAPRPSTAALRREMARRAAAYEEAIFRQGVLWKLLAEQTGWSGAEIEARVNQEMNDLFDHGSAATPEQIAQWLEQVVDDLPEEGSAPITEEETLEILGGSRAVAADVSAPLDHDGPRRDGDVPEREP
jgi:hypothetical protein